MNFINLSADFKGHVGGDSHNFPSFSRRTRLASSTRHHTTPSDTWESFSEYRHQRSWSKVRRCRSPLARHVRHVVGVSGQGALWWNPRALIRHSARMAGASDARRDRNSWRDSGLLQACRPDRGPIVRRACMHMCVQLPSRDFPTRGNCPRPISRRAHLLGGSRPELEPGVGHIER